MARKVEKLRQIVHLKQLVRRWRALSLLSGGSGSGSCRTEQAEGSARTGPIRPGYVAVYVGEDRERLMIPTRFMNLPVFATLLEQAEEEYGFQPAGGLVLPACDVGFLRWVVDVLGEDEDRFKSTGLREFLELFSESGDVSCKQRSAANGYTRLLNARV